MHEGLFYSLSSNCLIKSHLFQQKKNNKDLQFANRFRKMHLYNAIHSVSKQKLDHPFKLNNQQISSKDLFLSKNKKKEQFIQGIMEHKDKYQNKLVKLKHINALKRPQTFNKLPVDSRSMKFSHDKKSGRNELVVKSQQINKKQQRLSLRLSTKTQKSGRNEMFLDGKQKQKIKKWETACIDEFLFDDDRFKRSIQSSSIGQRQEKYELIKLPNKQMRRTEMCEVNPMRVQNESFNMNNRVSLHDHINESHNQKQSFTSNHHQNMIQNPKQRFSVTILKTHSHLFHENDSNKEIFSNKNGSLQKLKTLKQDNKQNVVSNNSKRDKLKPGYIQKFLKTAQLKNKISLKNATQTGQQIKGHSSEYHEGNFSHMNMIEILHPEGEFSTHFQDQFNPW